MQLTIKMLADALTSINGLKVYHYWRPRLEAPFCVFAEDGEGESFHSDNRKPEQVIKGTVDYYTRNEYDTTVDQIQTALDNLEVCGWELNSVQYENDTNLIHYEWNFQLAGYKPAPQEK